MLTPKRQQTMSNDITTTKFNFPFETLTKIEGEPTNATITILKRQIYANAMENVCTLGCQKLGYLGLIMPAADYRKKQVAITPGPFRPFTAPAFTGLEADDVLKVEERKLRDYNSMESILKKQILAAVEPTYVTALEDAELGFGFVTSNNILEHLITEYGTITLDDLAANIEKLNEPWNSEQPIRTLWDRIKECQRIGTEGEEPITDRMAMYTVLKLLDGTGLYNSYTTNWKTAYPIQTTWVMATFQAFFNHADKDRKKNLTTEDAGFHGANAVIKTTKSEAKPENTARTATNFVDPDTGKKIYYCWSHGGGTNPGHTSAKCKFPKDGHQKEATWFDMMEGCCDMKIGKNGPKKATKETKENSD